MKVGKKEFYSNVSKYIKPGIVILTNRGIEVLKIEVTNLGGNKVANKPTEVANVANVTTKPKDVQQRINKVLTTVPGMATVKDRPENIVTDGRYAKKFTPNWQRDTTKHGCGCKKEDGQMLCKTHRRA